jgi:hypothetical protein
MAVTHSTAARNTMVDAVTALINAGTTDATGDIAFLTAADVLVANPTFSATAYGAASSGVATANAITSDTNAVGGTIAKFQHRDRDNTVVVSGSVTATGGGGDYEITSVAVAAGETVAVTSSTYTGPA